ncbi:unnamed protein product [Adineta steineri]|uniref:Phosphatidylserine synthase n=1 Tax=Adineta steineri TaxID=433720 RepID=A0A813RFL8_9BILA|nr:unnamed protein product [Adineta steineri]CAF0787286.1 unnamed protein product [Adineta steineri]CAF0941191.1 unnamed protein product [Adineta steineri]
MTTVETDENRFFVRNNSSSGRNTDDQQPPVTPSSADQTVYDWESDKRRSKPLDDGTMSFFWRAHTITCLVIAMSYLFYVAILEQPSEDSSYNTKRGLLACAGFFLVFGMTQTPDGVFLRPHPALWRLVLCFSVLYEIVLIYILFQTVDEARQLIKHIDPSLGIPLPDKDYGGSCRIYDWEHPEDPFHFFKEKMDFFVLSHFFGWWLKTLIIRDYWLCMVTSIGFEILEYSLEHQLPNFSECWWDHWILDALICNSGGIYLGMKTCEYLKMKRYNWRGLWTIPTVRGKIMRAIGQFTPHDWLEFDWRPTASLKRWLAMLFITCFLFLIELGTFYLKFILWIPPPHYLCLSRLLFFLLAGGVAMREMFEYLDNPQCKKFGRQSWVITAIVITEVLIVFKFDWETVTLPLPFHIVLVWVTIASATILWTLYQFWFKRFILWGQKKNNQNARKNQ